MSAPVPPQTVQLCPFLHTLRVSDFVSSGPGTGPLPPSLKIPAHLSLLLLWSETGPSFRFCQNHSSIILQGDLYLVAGKSSPRYYPGSGPFFHLRLYLPPLLFATIHTFPLILCSLTLLVYLLSYYNYISQDSSTLPV